MNEPGGSSSPFNMFLVGSVFSIFFSCLVFRYVSSKGEWLTLFDDLPLSVHLVDPSEEAQDVPRKRQYQPLQRSKVTHLRRFPRARTVPGPTHYLLRATMSKVIERVELCGKRSIALAGEQDTICFLRCSTKFGSFTAIHSYRHLCLAQEKLKDKYGENISSTDNVFLFFQSLLSQPHLPLRNEVADILMTNIYRGQSIYM